MTQGNQAGQTAAEVEQPSIKHNVTLISHHSPKRKRSPKAKEARPYSDAVQTLAAKFMEELRSRALVRDFSKLNSESLDEPPYMDSFLAKPLREALSVINYELGTLLFQRGILTSSLYSALDMVQFLSIVLPAARMAQIDSEEKLGPFCIPASVLIAEASVKSMPICNSKNLEIQNNDAFGTGKRYRSVGDAFRERAKQLARDSRFRRVIRASRDSAQFVNELASCEVWEAHERLELLDRMRRHSLLDCDTIREVL